MKIILFIFLGVVMLLPLVMTYYIWKYFKDEAKEAWLSYKSMFPSFKLFKRKSKRDKLNITSLLTELKKNKLNKQ
jgi:hypothetical protein